MKFSCELLFASVCVPALSTSADVALVMQGGGWRAQSSYTALVSGLMGYMARDSGSSAPSLESTGLLNRFDHFSSVSGGSWFFASMAYSEPYNAMLNGMAVSPSTAAAQMNANWTTPILEATHVTPSKWDIVKKIAEDVAEDLIGTGDTEDLFMLTYFLATNSTWNAFTAVQLEAGAGIGPSMKMGSEVVPWAKDKVWLCDHSVLLPSGKKFAQLYQTNVIVPSARYKAESSNEIPIVTPAKFSIVMGAGEGSAAPHPYMGASAAVDSVDLNFLGVVVPILDEPDATSGPLDVRDYTDGVLSDGAGQLLVIDVASASSAAVGIAPVLGLLADEGLSVVSDADLTPWVSNAVGGAAFSTATELVEDLRRDGGVSKSSMNALAQAKVHGLIDGCYTDGTGLATAVAAGASEVVVLLNAGATSDSNPIGLLCKDGPVPKTPDAVFSPVFETSAATVKTQWQALDSLIVNGTSFLKEVKFGSFDLTTTDNAAFGVAAGRAITVRVVQLCATVTDGPLEDIHNYDAYVQELIETILADDNVATVKSALLPMFTTATGATIV